jgi:transcriptional activator SPT7
MILHALYENGNLAPGDIEAHIKDDIENQGVKLADAARKMKQAYKDIVSGTSLRKKDDSTDEKATAPVIEDDMMFAENGEMLLE